MSAKPQTVAAQSGVPDRAATATQRKALRKRNWVYYVLPYLEFEASCRSCGSGNITFRQATHPFINTKRKK